MSSQTEVEEEIIVKHEDKNIRDECRDQIFNVLNNINDNVDTNINIELITKIVKTIEKSIYNYTIDIADGDYEIKKWDNPRFSQIYIDKARELLTNLDPTDYVENKYLCDTIINRLEENEDGELIFKDIYRDKYVRLYTIAYLPPEVLYPEKNKAIYDEHSRRAKLASEYKPQTTDQFKCGKCGRRECTYTQNQIRACDEGATTFVYCTFCGHSFKI